MHTVSVSMLYEVQCLLVKSLFFFKPKQPTSACVYLRQRKWISLPRVWTKRYRSKISHIGSFICFYSFSFLYHLLIKSLVNQTKGESSVSLPGLKCKKKIDYHKLFEMDSITGTLYNCNSVSRWHFQFQKVTRVLL